MFEQFDLHTLFSPIPQQILEKLTDEELRELTRYTLVRMIGNGFATFIGTLLALFVWDPLKRFWLWLWYGGWSVRVLQTVESDGEPQKKEIICRKIGTLKAKQLREDETELSVFLKGVVSPSAWLNVDLVTEGRKIEMLKESCWRRQYVIDLDENPPPQPKPDPKPVPGAGAG